MLVGVAGNGNSGCASPVHHEDGPWRPSAQSRIRTKRLCKPNPRNKRTLRRRIRLRGLLRKSPALAGLFYSRPKARCITGASRHRRSSSADRRRRNLPAGTSGLVERHPGVFVLAFASSGRRLLTEESGKSPGDWALFCSPGGSFRSDPSVQVKRVNVSLGATPLGRRPRRTKSVGTSTPLATPSRTLPMPSARHRSDRPTTSRRASRAASTTPSSPGRMNSPYRAASRPKRALPERTGSSGPTTDVGTLPRRPSGSAPTRPFAVTFMDARSRRPSTRTGGP